MSGCDVAGMGLVYLAALATITALACVVYAAAAVMEWRERVRIRRVFEREQA